MLPNAKEKSNNACRARKHPYNFWDTFENISSIFWKMFDGQMLIRTSIKTLLQIFFKFMLYSKVIFKSAISPEDTYQCCQTVRTILEILLKTEHFLENIWWRNVAQNLTQNFPSNILRLYSLFQSYFQEYNKSRRHLSMLPNGPYNFGDTFENRTFFGKFLMDKCCTEPHSKLSFKYFKTSFFIPKLFSKIK